MIELLKSMSDDQIALTGCAAALLVAGTVMSLSYYVGRGRMASAKLGGSTPGSLITPQKPATLPAIAAQRREAA